MICGNVRMGIHLVDMKKIPVTGGKFCLVDDKHYADLSKFKWRLGGDYGRYAVRTIDRLECGVRKVTNIWMHREILGLPRRAGKLIVDHVNGNGLDNRRKNLRVTIHRLNCVNRPPKAGCASRFKGVSLERSGWRASLTSNKITYRINGFSSERDAAKAYNKMAIKYHGAMAWLNRFES